MAKWFRWVESKFGRDARTYPSGYNRGIWQVDDIGFKDTQNTNSHPGLSPFSTRRLFSREATFSFVGIAFADVISDADKGKSRFARKMSLSEKRVLRKAYDLIQRDLAIDWTKVRDTVGLAQTVVFWDSDEVVLPQLTSSFTILTSVEGQVQPLFTEGTLERVVILGFRLRSM